MRAWVSAVVCDVGCGEGGDAGETLREVEGDALGLEDAAGWALDGGDDCAGRKGLAVKNMEAGRDGGIGEGEGCGYDVLAAEDAWFARDELRRNCGVGGDEGLRGEVAPGSVFQERHTDDGVDGFAAGFHQHGTATCKLLILSIFGAWA